MVIQLSDDQQTFLESQAQQRGYSNIAEYLLALAQADALVLALGDDLIDEDGVDHSDDLRQAWHDVATGNTRPVSELWDALDDDDDES